MIGINTDLNSLEYSVEWKKQSSYFLKNKYYSWMASKINKTSNIIEVGSGCGFASVELVKEGHKIICVESNPDCAKATVNTLLASNINSVQVNNINDAITEFKNGNVPVVNIDVLSISDSEWGKLIANTNINCILCWLFGTYPDDFKKHGFHDPSKLREKIEFSLKMVFKTILPSASQLNIVNRGANKKYLLNPDSGDVRGEITYYTLEFKPLFEGVAIKSNRSLQNEEVLCFISINMFK